LTLNARVSFRQVCERLDFGSQLDSCPLGWKICLLRSRIGRKEEGDLKEEEIFLIIMCFLQGKAPDPLFSPAMEAIVPNWTWIVGTLLWVASFFLLKRYLFAPYQEILAQREGLAQGGEGSPLGELSRKVQDLEKKIEAERHRVAEELRAYREEKLARARLEGEELLRTIRQEEEENLRRSEGELTRELEEMERKLPELLAPLVREFRERLQSSWG
jgi:hypothetical protein